MAIITDVSELGWRLGGPRENAYQRTSYGEILFENDKSDFTGGVYKDYDGKGAERAATKVRRLVNYIKEQGRFEGGPYERVLRVLVTGSASANGLHAKNLKLAQARAEQVASAIYHSLPPKLQVSPNLRIAVQALGVGRRPEDEYILDRTAHLYFVIGAPIKIPVKRAGEDRITREEAIAFIKERIRKRDPYALAAQQNVGGLAETVDALSKMKPIPESTSDMKFWTSEKDKKALDNRSYLIVYEEYLRIRARSETE